MSFAWTGYLAVARELVAPGDHAAPLDARERAAISRAYYAVFGRAFALFVGRDEYRPKKSGDDHMGLVLELTNARDHSRREVGQTLNRLRLARRWADYEATPTPRPEVRVRTASTALVQAARALELCDAIEAES